MNTRYHYVFLTVLFFVFHTTSIAQTTVNGDISEDTIWELANSPFTVENTITVEAGNTLTIEPGVTVLMDASVSLLVDGTIVAQGTDSDRILFTSSSGTPAAGDWGSIELRNTSNVGSVLDYVIMEYGAGADRTGMIFYTTGAYAIPISNSIFRNSAVHGVNLRASSPVISESEFYDNQGYGIYTDLSLSFTVQNSAVYRNSQGGIRVPINSDATITESVIDTNNVAIMIDNGGHPTITNNQIRENTVGIRIIEVGATKPVITDNTISGNSEWGAENLGSPVLDARFNYWGSSLGPTVATNPTGNGDNVTQGNVDYSPWRYGETDLPVTVVDSNIGTDTVWESENVYLLTTNITVLSGNTLTVEPGTVVKFGSGNSLTIDGTLLANGLPESLIIFTSERDDAAGGDSNNDGDATTPSRGDWGQININSSGSVISHAIIRYGSSGSTSGMLNLDAAVSLNDIYVEQSNRYGIYSTISQSGWTDVRSTNNASVGIYFRETGLQMTDGETSLNGNHGLYFYSSDSETPVHLNGFTSSHNNGHGIAISGASNRQGTRIDSLLNSTISNNSSYGLELEYSDTGQQYFGGNTIEGNSGHGVRLHHGMAWDDVVFEDNSIRENGHTGILSTRARFIDNTFEGNRYGIGAWRNLGHRYTDDADQDNNNFIDNTYEAISLYATNLNDTLRATAPAAFDHPTYILASSGTGNSSFHTLVIEPGVTIKTSPELVSNSTSLRLDGTLIALGTEQDPIVFTSLRDHDFGGNVAAAGDEGAPSPDDWGGLNLYRSGTADSQLSHVYIRYGRVNLEMGHSGSDFTNYANTFENLWIDQASREGIIAEEVAVKFDGLRATDNSRSGILLRDRNSNGQESRVIVENSEITGNGGTNNSYAGLYAEDWNEGATFTVISNSIISGNSNGIRMEGATLPFTLLGSTIENNELHGVVVTSNLERQNVVYAGNTVSGNAQTGILSTQARFINNTFEGNQFPIGAWKRLGHSYVVDENDVDENNFENNIYNNAIGLYATSLRDTLSATAPAAFDHPTYILASSGTGNSSSHTLVIEPGVTIKTAPELVSNSTSLRLDGTLIALGTEQDPIVFTSLRDHDYGGNVAAAGDEGAASPDDWGGLNLYRSGTADSQLSHVYIRYGRVNLEMGHSGSDFTNYANTFENLWVDQASREGMLVEEVAATFDGLRVTDSGRSGILLRDRNSNGQVTRMIIRNSEITGNGGTNSSYAGLYAEDWNDGATFTEVSNTLVQDNANGIRMNGASLPASLQFNDVSANIGNGFYARMVEVETDTVLAISGNTFSNHESGTGIISTRAIIEDNEFENNRFPIAVMDEISKPGTVNNNGNFYSGNTIGEHTYKDAIGLYSTSSLSLNGNLGHSWPETYENPVYIPLTSTTFINSGDSVNVAPGTVFKLGMNGSNDSFRIRGTMHAAGFVDNKIVFTSLRDDTYAGDTNRDSTDTVPTRGDWRELLVENTSSSGSFFKHVIARYGNSNFNFNNSTEAIVDSSFVSNASSNGIYTQSGAKPTIRNSDIHSNRYGVRVVSNSDDPNLHLNNFFNNDDAALYASRDVTATNNYWGGSSGPFVDQGSNTDPNLDGDGDTILATSSTRVEYEPFRVARTGVLLGDVSQDGSISAFDASMILQYLVDLITLSSNQLAAADVTGDGSVSAMDASFVLQYVVGSQTGFPGAGKVPGYNPEDLYDIETILADTYFDLIVKSKGTIPVFAGQINIQYQQAGISGVELLSTTQTQNWLRLMNDDEGTVKVALAGEEAAMDEGDIIHLRFNFEDEYNGSADEWDVLSFKFNEIDLTESANQILTSVTDELTIPDSFSLEQNFPNPFNPSTQIRYQLPVSGEVTVRIYNSIGQSVATLVNRQQQQAGIYTLNWDAESAASGIYFYRIEVAGENGRTFTDVRKMTLIK